MTRKKKLTLLELAKLPDIGPTYAELRKMSRQIDKIMAKMPWPKSRKRRKVKP
jgi:hypothetical protein